MLMTRCNQLDVMKILLLLIKMRVIWLIKERENAAVDGEVIDDVQAQQMEAPMEYNNPTLCSRTNEGVEVIILD